MYGLAALTEFLHIAGAVVFIGGQALFYVAVFPALLEKRPSPDLFASLGRRAGPVMGIAGLSVILFGVLRGTVFGPIRSFGDLLSTRYGHELAAAFVLTMALGAHSGYVRGRLIPMVIADGDAAPVNPGTVAFLRRHTFVFFVLFAAVLLVMVAMSLGL